MKLSLLGCLLLFATALPAQRPRGGPNRFVEMEQAALAESFTAITDGEGLKTGLFPIALARSKSPTRNCIHAVIRTPNLNDYGKDLLRQHRESKHEK